MTTRSVIIAAFSLSLMSTTALAQVASPEVEPSQARSLPDPMTVPPMPLPEPTDLGDIPQEETLVLPEQRPGRSSPSQPPIEPQPLDSIDLNDWLANPPDLDEREDPTPRATAPNGWRFTTSRVFPKTQLLTYPYTTIGKVTSSDSSCTGSVINRRLVLTAGHCVYDAVERRWYKDFAFYPGFYEGLAPTGAWTVRQAWTTNQWINGGERLPNPGDFAVLIIHDKFSGNAVKPIGHATGWLGWQTQQFGEHFTQFGYPGNLDAAFKPQQTTAQVAQINPIDFRWGTNQTEGSSGGPLIRDFGENATGQTVVTNIVVGVVSFGLDRQGFAGSSKPSTSFANLVRAACNAHVGNCQ